MRKIVFISILCLVGFQANAQTEFITTWKTDNPGASNSTSITIPISGGGYSYDVDWNNDGVFDDFGVTDSITHDYGVAGTYTVAIQGNFPRIAFNNSGDKGKILSIEQWGTNVWESMNAAFHGCTNLIVINATDAPDLSAVTDMSSMFRGASTFNSDLENWDVSNVTDMSYMFLGASTFNGDIDNWDVGNVTNMYSMFYTAFTFNRNIESWDVGNVTNMSSMFAGVSLFNHDIGNWNVSNVTNMLAMFNGAYAFNQNIGDWNVGNVTAMGYMFAGASTFNQDIGNWDVSNVTDMAGMFYKSAVFNQDIGDWNVGNVTAMNAMFQEAPAFNRDIGDWNVGQVTQMNNMFRNASAFNQNIESWNVGNVTDMSAMFREATTFNGALGNWNVSNVTSMYQMFLMAHAFNKNIGNWDVGNVVNMSVMFREAFVFNQDIGSWDVGDVANMSQMFYKAYAFNRDIANWDVSNVTDMSYVFRDASAFNRDIGDWDVSNVTDMNQMFTYASAFNQNIGNWDVSSVANMSYMFFEVSLSTPHYDALLTGWNSLTLQNNVAFHGGYSKYCNGEEARANMINTFGWSITDGGLDSGLNAVCKNITIQLDDGGNAVITGYDVDDGSGSGCSGSYNVSPNVFDCSNIGANSVILTVTDTNGNQATCTAIVTVEDITAPEITCMANETVSSPYTLPDYFGEGLITATDNCADPVVITSQDPSVGTELSDGTHTVTFTAEDSYGNIGTCTFELIVDGTIGIVESELNTHTLRLYPNPAKDNITIENQSNTPLQKLDIYDLTGRLVKTVDLSYQPALATVNVSNLRSATYIVKITSDDGSIIKKLLID